MATVRLSFILNSCNGMRFSQFLKAFTGNCRIAKVRRIHGRILTSGSHSDVYTNNQILSTYLGFGRIQDAHNLFDRIPHKSIVSWTLLISGYSKMGHPEEALNCFKLMVDNGIVPNEYTYVSILSACSSIRACRTGKEIHGRMYRMNVELSTYVTNALVNMYGKCGLFISAKLVFDAIPDRNHISWTSLLSAHCQDGRYAEGLRIFIQSRKLGFVIDEFSCTSLFTVCTVMGNFHLGSQIHTLVVKHGFAVDRFVGTSLINFYAKLKILHSAHKIFSEIKEPNVTAWTALIGGCAQFGDETQAFLLFTKLRSSGLKPNERTLTSLLGAFVDASKTNLGKQIHALIKKLGLDSRPIVSNAVLGFYAKCGLFIESSKIFDEISNPDVISWNALIYGCVRSGHYKEASEILSRMLLDGFEPNTYTYSSVLRICGDLPSLGWGKQAHCRALKPGFVSDVVVGSSLIDMYAKCGRLGDALKIFENLKSRNVVSWNSMLVGYAHHGSGRDALNLYYKMMRHGVRPNSITFVGILTACANMGFLEEGLKCYDSMIKEYGIVPRTDHLGCMVSLFGRKGYTKRAHEFILECGVEPDIMVWRCLLAACKIHNDVDLGRLAAERVLSFDREDCGVHVSMSNVYADARMWEETANLRRGMKEKELKKYVGYSLIELGNTVFFFASGSTVQSGWTTDLQSVLYGLTGQLIDEGFCTNGFA